MLWNAATDDLNGPNKKKPVASYEQAYQNAETAVCSVGDQIQHMSGVSQCEHGHFYF
eukprot:CAMPEP_0172189492 /NCGR_PEP_ID=MMETSP1050-20130122/22553_1 /TAXON_ID=233186 /ORGANISM="Cryptomonas curvata, Strain CCAP979/52" /LENGTH=56 /DNA_ID=CAMNT_0012864191 /DNA_START=186 /DNA_END=356 /DNA_ORIENTATION=+